MGTSRLPATIDALVDAFVAAELHVFDGPLVTGDYTEAVFVGYDGGGDDSEFRSASTSQQWANLGAKVRGEDLSIVCAVAAVDGGNSPRAARLAVYALFSTVELVVRADPSLGQSPPFVAEVLAADLFTEPTTGGMQCRLVFTIHVRTRM